VQPETIYALILGGAIGAVVSGAIGWVFARESARDLRAATDELRAKINAATNELQGRINVTNVGLLKQGALQHPEFDPQSGQITGEGAVVRATPAQATATALAPTIRIEPAEPEARS
jgi:gas vesicle protein